MKFRAAAAMVLAAVALAGCAGPREHVLRIDAGPPCPQGAQAAGGPIVAFRGFESLPGLNRTAVLVADARVMTPSGSWYYEGTPAEILTLALERRLTCEGRVRTALPENVRARPAALLSGRVTSFEVHAGAAPEFRVEAAVSLYDGQSRQLAATRTFAAREPLAALQAEDVAAAAGRAVAAVGAQAAEWVAQAAR